jgi:hypothetical protein
MVKKAKLRFPNQGPYGEHLLTHQTPGTASGANAALETSRGGTIGELNQLIPELIVDYQTIGRIQVSFHAYLVG